MLNTDYVINLSYNNQKTISINQEIPRSGLNYLINKKYDKNFLLLCGFEKFKNHYVRIDILDKLFIKILNKTDKRKFKIDADMMTASHSTCSEINWSVIFLQTR